MSRRNINPTHDVGRTKTNTSSWTNTIDWHYTAWKNNTTLLFCSVEVCWRTDGWLDDWAKEKEKPHNGNHLLKTASTCSGKAVEIINFKSKVVCKRKVRKKINEPIKVFWRGGGRGVAQTQNTKQRLNWTYVYSVVYVLCIELNILVLMIKWLVHYIASMTD